MSHDDRPLNEVAARRRSLLTRADALEEAGSDRVIHARCGNRRWHRVHAGVYVIGVAPLDWHGRLHAAVLAAGEGAVASHRAAVLLWGLDGIGSAPAEITVPINHLPLPAGVIVHRTRRPVPTAYHDGIAVTTVERTVLDAPSCLPPVVVEKVLECAVRRGLTTVTKIDHLVRQQGGKGVRGSGVLKEMLAARPAGRAAGSPSEVELLRELRLSGVSPPRRQHGVSLLDGTVAVVDLAWPELRKAVEVDGLDTHATAAALDYDDDRQNQLFDVGWELRRFSARRVRRDPSGTAARIRRFLRG